MGWHFATASVHDRAGVLFGRFPTPTKAWLTARTVAQRTRSGTQNHYRCVVRPELVRKRPPASKGGVAIFPDPRRSCETELRDASATNSHASAGMRALYHVKAARIGGVTDI